MNMSKSIPKNFCLQEMKTSDVFKPEQAMLLISKPCRAHKQGSGILMKQLMT